MREQYIGSLIYGDHPPPPKPGAWKKRAAALTVVALVLLIAAGATYKYINYREETRVMEFLNEIRAGQYENAFARWDAKGSYGMTEFLQDWGSEGVYTKGATQARIVTSHRSGSMVIVQVAIDKFEEPVALRVNMRVNKETFKLSYSPYLR